MFCVVKVDCDGPHTVQTLESFEEARDAALALSADNHLTLVADVSACIPALEAGTGAVVKLWSFRNGRELTDAEMEAEREENVRRNLAMACLDKGRLH